VTSTGTYTPLYSIQQRLAGTSDTVTYNDGSNQASAILMPWLNQVAGVFEGFYDGQEWGQAIAALLFGDVNPSGKLPITFPTSLTALPANTAAQWPGINSEVQYSEGLDVGYRWYEANNLTPLFPFGYGLSYTTFSYSNLNVGAVNNGQATVTPR
jgi:beta-glucosidase